MGEPEHGTVEAGAAGTATDASAPPEATAAALDALLRRLSFGPPAPPAPPDVALIARALLPGDDRHARALAYLCLSKLTSSSSLPADAFTPLLDDTFTAAEPDVLPLAHLAAALAALAPQTAVDLLTRPIESTVPPSDALALLLELAELPGTAQAAVAELLAALAGAKAGRDVVRARAAAWLRGALELPDSDAAALAAVALAKLGRAEPGALGEPAPGPSDDAPGGAVEAERLARALSRRIETGAATADATPAVEGLAVLSLRPRVKRFLASSPGFLAALLALSPVPQRQPGSLPVTPRASIDTRPGDPALAAELVDGGLCYGLTTVLVNLTARAPDQSDEEAQIARLRKVAIAKQSGASDGDDQDDADSEADVAARVDVLVAAGVVDALHGLVRAESRAAREALGQLCLNLVHEQRHRPAFVRGGGYKVLSAVLRGLLGPPAEPAPAGALPAAQALAKLAITTAPALLFPAPAPTTALDALRPLAALLAHPAARPLQQFEALMALTNLASVSPDVAGRIARATVALPETSWRGAGADARGAPVDLMDKVDELVLDVNALVRRAAVELICNVVSSEPGFMRYTGEGADGAAPSAATHARVQARLNVLLVLTDADDAPTCGAAAGAIAVLSQSAHACRLILEGRGISSDAPRTPWERVARLLDPDPAKGDLAFRAAWVCQQLVEYVDGLGGGEEGKRERARIRESALEEKIREVLLARVRDGDRWGMAQPLAECLKTIKAWA